VTDCGQEDTCWMKGNLWCKGCKCNPSHDGRLRLHPRESYFDLELVNDWSLSIDGPSGR